MKFIISYITSALSGMTLLDGIILVLSLSSTACIILTSYIRSIRWILFLQAMGNLTIALGYLLDKSYSGAVSCLIGAATAIISGLYDAKSQSVPMFMIYIYAAAFIVANLFAFTAWYSSIALVASVVYVLSVVQKSGKFYRVWTIVNLLLWVAYDLFAAAYGSLTSHTIMVLFIFSGIILDKIRDKKGVA